MCAEVDERNHGNTDDFMLLTTTTAADQEKNNAHDSTNQNAHRHTFQSSTLKLWQREDGKSLLTLYRIRHKIRNVQKRGC